MYSWNVQALAQELKTNQLPEGEKMKYLLASAVLETVLLHISSLGGSGHSLAGFADLVIALTLTIGGIYLCYEANQLGDKRDFIARFVCLNWPMTIRLIVYFAVPYMLLGLIELRLEDAGYEDRAGIVMVELVLNGAVLLAFYLWMRAQLLWISGALDRKTDEPAPEG